MEVEDLVTDLADWQKPLKLLEKSLASQNQGGPKFIGFRKSLAFLHIKVMLENIAAEDIVDENQRINLGIF